MDNDSEKPANEETCPDCTTDLVCGACIKRLRDSGIPEATLEWLGRPKDERIRSVMF